MLSNQATAIDSLIQAIAKMGTEQPNKITYYRKGQRFINEGEAGSDLFLITEGIVSILRSEGETRSEIEIALRKTGDLVGEGGFLQRNVVRGASVEVVTEDASAIRVSRDEVFELIRNYPHLKSAIVALAQMSNARSKETTLVIQGMMNVEISFMSVLLADIHNFSIQSDLVPEEFMNIFLFEFLESADEISERYTGTFEDQGDGFKVMFTDEMHAKKAVNSSIDIMKTFLALRSEWSNKDPDFAGLGLGIGICTDVMSIRRRIGSRKREGRVLSPTINLAAAISKYRATQNEAAIYMDTTTLSLLSEDALPVERPQNILLEKLGRRIIVHRISPNAYAVQATKDEINEQMKLLGIYRKSLSFLLEQRAALGSNFVPTHILNSILDSRQEIQRIKGILRRWGVAVRDHPDDEFDDALALGG